MALKVGVIGTGLIGRDHIRRLTGVVPGVEVVAVSDVDTALAESAAVASGARVHSTGEDLISDERVDAVLVCSWGASHEAYVLASIAAGKPVFCEKPLAPTIAECLNIVDAEVAHGSRLLQVGFMRRYDPAYQAMKQAIEEDSIGAPLMFHSVHRNASVPEYYLETMAITDTAIHDFDISRWLLDDEPVAIRVLEGRSNSARSDIRDPLLTIVEMATGVLVDVETSVTIQYGYDVRGEVVGETGTLSLTDTSPIAVRSSRRVEVAIDDDWRQRFATAYDSELRAWVEAVVAGQGATGPSAWDGYAAQAVAEAGLVSLRTGERVAISLVDRPGLYL